MVTITAWDLNTNTLLTNLTVQEYTWSIRLNDAGEFSAKINLSDPNVSQQAALLLGLNGNPFVVCFASDAQNILYSGIAWKTERESGNPQMKISGKAMPSFFDQVALTKSYSSNEYPSGISPAVLLQTVINDVQAVAPAHITPALLLQSPPPPMTPGYKSNQYTTVGQVLADVTAAAVAGTGGVDYYMNETFVNGAPLHQFAIAAPRCGRTQASGSGLTMNLARAIKWTWPTDAQQSGTQIVAIGAGSGNAQNKAVKNTAYPHGGLGQMPFMQVVLQYTQISSPTQLANIANGALNLYQKPVTVPVITLDVNDPILPLGTYQIGDDVRVQVAPNIWFPNGLDQWWRIAAYTVNYPNQGIATQAITLNRPPVF